ncbi:hypothetical protein ACFTWH_01360 [Streptomyces sp. NPDC057011]|uniref:hypothetical protein n=1 Tax=unclassified Streptomyces TaxID=2593676 RepID=UPI00363B25BA
MHRFIRYTVPAALCVTLLAASPGLASATNAPEQPPAPVAGKAVPGTEALLAQVQALGALGGLLKPVTDLLEAVLKSVDGKIPEADLNALKAKIDAALEDLKKKLPATPALPLPVPAPDLPVKPPVDLPVPAPDLPVKPPVDLPVPAPDLPVKPPVDLPVPAPDLPVKPPVDLPAPAPALPVKPPVPVPVPLPVSAPAAAGPASRTAVVRMDAVTDAIDKLKAALDGLTKVAGPCGCSTDAKGKATDVVTSLIAALVALLTGLGLPLPPLPVPLPVP